MNAKIYTNSYSKVNYACASFLFVFPDPRKIPNPAVNLHVTDEEDQRIGFFGHAILKVTWDHPDSELACMHSGVVSFRATFITILSIDMQYLDYYQVKVTPASSAMRCQTSYISGLLPSVSCNCSDILMISCWI